ncbi:MAG: leucine-rich repeat domain-containing protein [Clostridia bacterium]|nr:leucine-rich repeat domain-containing protein [Clostridia bacterium]
MKKAMLAESIGMIDISIIEDFIKTDAAYDVHNIKRKKKKWISALISAACIALVISIMLVSLPMYVLIMPEEVTKAAQEYLMPENAEDSILGDWTKWSVVSKAFELLHMGEEKSFANTLKQMDNGLLGNNFVQAGCLLDMLYEYYLAHIDEEHEPTQETPETEEYPIPIPEVSQGLKFEKTSAGNYCLTGFTLNEDRVVCIPAEYQGRRVVEIKKDLFRENDLIKEVYILGGVGAIQEYTFKGCDSLELVYMGDSVSVIRQRAFVDCPNLREVYLSESLTEIEMCAFENCTSLQSLSIPDSTKKIGIYAFNGCSSLSQVDMPASMKFLGEHAFYSCSSLKEINIPSGIESLDENIFAHCSSLEKVTVADGLKSVANQAFYGCSSLRTLELPDSVTEIADRAFEGCGLTEFTIPAGVTEIKQYTFANCKNLTKITLHEGVVTFRQYAFRDAPISEYYYTGTIAQWKKIMKYDKWFNHSYTVYCSDGEI